MYSHELAAAEAYAAYEYLLIKHLYGDYPPYPIKYALEEGWSAATCILDGALAINVGTIGHVDHGPTLFTAYLMEVINSIEVKDDLVILDDIADVTNDRFEIVIHNFKALDKIKEDIVIKHEPDHINTGPVFKRKSRRTSQKGTNRRLW